MRAREPDIEGYVERRGVKVGYEVFGDGDPTILLLPSWAIVHSRVLEGAGRVPREALPRHHLRPPRQRAKRPA